MNLVALNGIGAAIIIAPVTLALAGFEASGKEGTPGKRVRRLAVVDVRTGARVSYPRSLGRNALKIALPWLIGHSAAFALAESGSTGTVSPAIWALTVFAYVIPLLYLIALFVGSGRTPYDRISGTVVKAQP
jgi:uncharacterized RDD family membrane protein YckC